MGLMIASFKYAFVGLCTFCLIHISHGDESSVCRPAQKCNSRTTRSDSYFWPTAHGHVRHYGNSPYEGPFNLSASVTWSWHHPDGQYNDMPMAASIDEKKNVYVTADQ